MFLKSLKEFSVTSFLIISLSLSSSGSYASLTAFSVAVPSAISFFSGLIALTPLGYIFDKDKEHKCKRFARSVIKGATKSTGIAAGVATYVLTSYAMEGQEFDEKVKSGIPIGLGVFAGAFTETILNKVADCGFNACGIASSPQYTRQSDESMHMNDTGKHKKPNN